MERAAGSTVHPPYFDGYNYGAWKAKMKSFLWSFDERVWNIVVHRFSEPTKITGKGDEEHTVPKPREEWTNVDVTHSTNNQKALNALFTAVSPDQFEYISGEKISADRVVKKILRSLPQRFQLKVTAIEEIRDLNTMKVSELIGSLQTYEMKHLAPKKKKSVAFNVVNKEEDDHQNEEFNAKEFTKKRNSEEKTKCFECEGYGHIASECDNTMKKQNSKTKAWNATWRNNESESKSEENTVTLITTVSLDEASKKNDDEGLDIEFVLDKYDDLLAASQKLSKQNAELVKTIAVLKLEKRRIAN
ncbi:uncharacterized protein LOC18778847 [Prunus persica]|uniref:uncharacterized protein LOC18778847 n=1 Tax=Prunus persica TaxID=3760 RepID=UPI0009AB93E5|nr:uncharacterized protein LOC18778847 [Prunus persica]